MNRSPYRVSVKNRHTAAHQVTLADLMQRYMQDKVCRKHKGAKVEAWTLKGFIADSFWRSAP
jgi:hypothetical protein